MKKIINIIITCLVCLSIVGCSSGSRGTTGGGAGKKEKNIKFNQDCKAVDFFDTVFKEEYLITLGYNGQGDICFSTNGFHKDDVMYENEDFQVIYEKRAEYPQSSIDFGIFRGGERYGILNFTIDEYKEALKNGDEVIIVCDVYPDNFSDRDFADLGYDFEYSSMKYKIKGLDDRITSIKEIDASKLYEVINSCSEEGTAITAYFLTLKKGAEPKYAACTYGHYVDETQEQGKKSVFKYSTGRRYRLETILFIYYDAGEYMLSGEVRKHSRYTIKGIPNLLKNSLYDEHTFDSSFLFKATTLEVQNPMNQKNPDFTIERVVYGLEWDVKEDGYGSVEEFLNGMFSEQYEITEVK